MTWRLFDDQAAAGFRKSPETKGETRPQNELFNPPSGKIVVGSTCPKAVFHQNVRPLATLADMKDTGLRIRVQRDLRDRFVRVCQAQDKPAVQVLREYMRTYVDEHKELLADDPTTNSEPKVKGGGS